MSRIRNLLRNINYLSKISLWDQREKDIVYLTNKVVDDVSIEYGIRYPKEKMLNILSTDETLELLRTCDKSFIRTGDGEITLMQGKDHPFQQYNREIADRLISALQDPPENLLVGINQGYFIPLFQYDNHAFYRRNAYEFRDFYRKYCSENTTYIDASCIGPLKYSESKEKLIAHYEKWRQLFANRDVAIVCGSGLLDEFEYDIFELVRSRITINCPRTNAWSEHDIIMQKIKKDISKDILLIFILGQAGKAMITELVELGYTCWDVGHLAKYYNTIMKGEDWAKQTFFAPD